MQNIRRRLGIGILVVLFLGSALLKLVPDPSAKTLLTENPGFAVIVALLEIAIAVALLVPRARRWGALFGAVVVVVGGFYVVWDINEPAPSCGCFGGWVGLTAAQHLVVVGVSLFFLSDHVLHARRQEG